MLIGIGLFGVDILVRGCGSVECYVELMHGSLCID